MRTSGCRRDRKGPSVRMPDGLGSSLMIRLQAPDQAIDLRDQLWLFSAEGVDVEDPIRARYCEVHAARMKREMLDRLRLLPEMANSCHVLHVDQFDFQLAKPRV